MADRPRFFDDIAGVAGGAISALAGLRDEAESVLRARVDDILQRMDLVRREEFEAVQELAANARNAQETAEAHAAALEARLSALEARVAVLEITDTDAVGSQEI
nr:accessory factor UbiK family protein [uncultured Rhodopila sp.]